MSDAKQTILNRIRAATRRQTESDRVIDYEAVSRNFARSGMLARTQCVELFCDRLHEYGCGLYRAKESAIAATIRDALRRAERRRLLVTVGFPGEWLLEDLDVIRDSELPNSEIEKADGVITGCAFAIANTGTIVLRHSLNGGRRLLTLIPDYHLCVVFENQIVETVPEGVERMEAFATDPITTISGPSATSDIEMTRIKGVHGPRSLDVLVVSSSSQAEPLSTR